jgi:hypothetical protein
MLRPELRPDQAASASRVKPEPAARIKPEPPPPLASPLTQPAPSARPRVPPPLPSGFATAAPPLQPAPPLFDPNAGLDPDQLRALAVALSGRSLFLTGGAGVGKSFTLRRIVGALQQRHGINAVAVTASTGTASVHLEPDGQARPDTLELNPALPLLLPLHPIYRYHSP